MNLSVDGIVLSSVPYGKNSKALTILTASRGKISAVARGCVSLKSPLHACVNLFTYSAMELFQNGGKYYVNTADIKELFFPLYSDIEKLSLAQYFLEVCSFVAQEESEETELLRLLLNTLYKLCNDDDCDLIKAVFEIRLCEVLGVMPDIEGCALCGADTGGFISLEDGVLLCENCAGASPTRVFVNSSARAALTHIFFSPVGKIFSFKLAGEGREQLLNFAEKYLFAQTGLKSKCLDFYRSVKKGTV